MSDTHECIDKAELIELRRRAALYEEQKPKTIDFTKLPVDTLVDFGGTLLRIALPPVYPNSVRLFRNGGDSLTMVGDSINVSCDEIKLVEGRKVVWEGGECPLPDGVEVRVCIRDGRESIQKARFFNNWVHHNNSSDIIWYQITGE